MRNDSYFLVFVLLFPTSKSNVIYVALDMQITAAQVFHKKPIEKKQ